MKKYLIALLVIVLVLIVAGAVYFKLNKPTVPAQVACTMEAKLCPDGVTSVGRQGPKCEFAECPVVQAVGNKTNCINTKYGYELTYPAGWQVWARGDGAPIPATCSERQSYYFAKDLSGTPFKNQINLIVFARDEQVKEFWKTHDSLDDYVKLIKGTTLSVEKETKLNGERLVWFRNLENSSFGSVTYRLVAYHNDSIYEFDIYSVDNTTLDQFLSTFKFTK